MGLSLQALIPRFTTSILIQSNENLNTPSAYTNIFIKVALNKNEANLINVLNPQAG